MKRISYHQFRSRPRKNIPAFPAFYTIDYASTNDMIRRYGMKAHSLVFGFPKDEIFNLIGSKQDYEKIGKIILVKILKDDNYLSNIIEWSEKKVNSLRVFLINNFKKDKIGKIPNKKFSDLYLKFIKKYRNFHLINTPPWWIGADAVEKELLKELRKKRIKNYFEIFQILISYPEYKSENFKEEISLLKIANEFKKFKYKKVERINSLPLFLQKKFFKHIETFSSIPFGYNTGVVWDKKYFLRKINEHLDKNDIDKKIKQINIRNQEIIKQRTRIENKLNISLKIKILSRAIGQLSYLQDLKKITQTRSHPHLQLIVNNELVKRFKIPKEYLNYMSVNDICEALSAGLGASLRREIKERIKFSVLISSDYKYHWIYGKKAEKFLIKNNLFQKSHSIGQITGIIASRGRVKGIIKVCKFSTEISKIKNGDILVTSMTTPDFVPGMKKASAIITDEGGITCHAAIISRELGIPCIIGTKIATKVLHDGDLVEVDANKGVVKILKRATKKSPYPPLSRGKFKGV